MRHASAWLVLCFALAASGAPQPQSAASSATYKPDTPNGSTANADLRVFEPGTGGWLFPVTRANQSLPRWLQFGAQFRSRVEAKTGLDFKPVDDVYDLTQLRVGVYIEPARWIKLVGVTQDSRAFFNHHVPNRPSYQNLWDLRESYIQLGCSDAGWLDLVAGRQLFSFGDERVLGPSEWANMGRTFDAIRLNLHYTGFKASLFASSVIVARDGEVDHHYEGNNLYGIYSSFSRIVPKATVEPYALWRLAPGQPDFSETAGLGHLSEVTAGVRVAGVLPANFDYDVEMNRQTGSLGPRSIRAWAGHWNVGHTFTGLRSKPRPFLEYNYATGNNDTSGRYWETHDQIYPSSHNKMEFADLFGWRNISNLREGATEKLSKRWELTQIVNTTWLATVRDALYSNSGSVAVEAHPGATSRYVGTELDLVFQFKQNAHMTHGFGFAHLFTGSFLNQTTPGKDFNYPFAYSTYVF